MAEQLRLVHCSTVDLSLWLLLATELRLDRQAGFRVYGMSAPGPFGPQLQDLGVTHLPVPMTRNWSPWRDVVAFATLWRALRRLQPHIVHTHTPKAGVIGRVAARLARVPVVVNTSHGLYVRDGDPRFKRALVLLVEAIAAQFSDFELYQNDDDRRALRRFVSSGRSRVVGNGIDLKRFRRSEHARAIIRAELGIGEHDVLIGGVGRIVWEKGVAEFGEAARALAEEAKFVWIGPVEEGPAEKALPAHVQRLGMREDMPDIYSALDIFVLPSYREGFSRSAMEAAACGCALVLSDIRGCREVGRHGEHLLLVPPRDSKALTAAVRGLIADQARRASLAHAGRERATERFDQRAVAQASIETYAAVARRKRLSWADHPSLSP